MANLHPYIVHPPTPPPFVLMPRGRKAANLRSRTSILPLPNPVIIIVNSSFTENVRRGGNKAKREKKSARNMRQNVKVVGLHRNTFLSSSLIDFGFGLSPISSS